MDAKRYAGILNDAQEVVARMRANDADKPEQPVGPNGEDGHRGWRGRAGSNGRHRNELKTAEENYEGGIKTGQGGGGGGDGARAAMRDERGDGTQAATAPREL